MAIVQLTRADDNVEDEECNKFLNRLHKIRIRYNLSEIDTLNEIMNLGEGASHAMDGILWMLPLTGGASSAKPARSRQY